MGTHESEERIIQQHRPLTREWPAPRPPENATPLRELLDEITATLRAQGESLPGAH
jgi:hypothetical protein